jgi:hypothetical protein
MERLLASHEAGRLEVSPDREGHRVRDVGSRMPQLHNIEAEPVVSVCPFCRQNVTTYWMKNNSGCLSRPEYTLVADWAFHSACWDKFVEQNPVAP